MPPRISVKDRPMVSGETPQQRSERNRKAARNKLVTKRRKARGTVSTYLARVTGNSRSLFSNIGPLGGTFTTNLYYVQHAQMDPPKADEANKVLSVTAIANGLADPIALDGAHQPYLFDQMMSLYTRYEVMASTIEMHIHSNPTSAIPAVGAIALRDYETNTDFTQLTANTLMERKDVTTKYIVPNYHTPLVIRKSWNSKSYFKGLVPEGSDELKGFSNANPVKDVKYICMVAPWSGTDNPVVVRVAFKIRYTVKFSSPRDIDPS